MSTIAQRETSVTIERWNNVYSVPGDHPAPHDIQRRLDDFVRGDVVDACRRRLASLLDEDDGSVWMIRELHLDLALDASAAMASRAAEYWGEQVAMGIHRALYEEAPTLLRFKDRTAYVAQWVRDMAAGQAWGKWYYTEFESLRSLPMGAAIAEGIVREEEARRVVLQIAEAGGLEQVLSALHESDAAKVFRRVGDEGFGAGAAGWVARVAGLMRGIPLAGRQGMAHDALRLYAAAKREYADAHEDGLGDAIRAVVALRRAMAQMTAERAEEFRSALVARDREEAVRVLRGAAISIDDETLRLVARIADAEREWVAALASAVMPAETVKAEEAFLTEFGGVFLLGPVFADLCLHEALGVAALACEEPEHAAAILRLVLAVHCLGGARACSSVEDSAVRLFAGVERAASLREIAETLRAARMEDALAYLDEVLPDDRLELVRAEGDGGYFAVSAVLPELEIGEGGAACWTRLAAAVLRLFAARLPGFARSSPEYLFQNFLAGTSSIRCGEGQIEVRLAHCPLAVVLQIAGAYRGYELPWRKGVEICLLAPSG